MRSPVRKSIRDNPITVVDQNTANKVINAVIFDCYVSHRGAKTWVTDARERLSNFNIHQAESSIYRKFRDLVRGKRSAGAASLFKSKNETESKISCRSGKDNMYSEFYGLADYLCKFEEMESRYVGLPANQIVQIGRKFDYVAACEFNEKTFDFLVKLKETFLEKENVEIYNENIIQFLLETEDEFNIFDIDLMSIASSTGLIDSLADGIARTAMSSAVICVVTACGRRISEREYKRIMPARLLDNLRKDFYIEYNNSGGYVDKHVPMRYEIVVVNR